MNLKIGIAQTPNSTSLERNYAAIRSFLNGFESSGVELVLFPECSLSGFSAKMKECDRTTLSPYLKKIQEWTDKSGIEVVLPTAIVDDGRVYNSGFWFRPGSAQPFYKTGLTESEKKFFSVPDEPLTKVFNLKGVRFGILICFEAQHDPWKYFKVGEVDIVLWPGYWGWTEESEWSAENEPNKPNLIYLNQQKWKCPVLQANFAFNDLEGHTGPGPEGLSFIINSDSSLVHRGPHKKAEGFIVNITRQAEQFHVSSCNALA